MLLAGLACGPAAAQETSPANEWTVETSAALAYMMREGVGGPIVTNTNGGATVIAASDLGLDWTPGADLRLSLMKSDWGVEARFFGLFDWESEFNTANAGLLLVFGVNVGGASQLPTTYRSSLDTLEFNAVWRPTSRLDLLGGLRWVNLDEQLDIGFAAGGPILLTGRNHTSSEGFGPQIGMRLHLLEPRPTSSLYLDVEARVAAIHFEHDSLTGFVPPVGNPIFPSNRSSSTWSPLVEIGAVAGFKVSEKATIELGYRLMYINNVAIATVGGLGNASGETPTSHLLMHGVTAGLKIRF